MSAKDPARRSTRLKRKPADVVQKAAPKPLKPEKRAAPPVVVVCKKQKADSLAIVVQQVGGMPRQVAAAVAANTHVIPQNHLPNVVCQAVTGPNDDGAEHANVQWAIVPGAVAPPNGQTVNVPANATGRFTVTATYLGIVRSVDIWVIWCNLVITLGDGVPIPAGCNVDFATPNTAVTSHPNQLGRHRDLVAGFLHGVGRVCVTGTFLPAGVHAVLTANIAMRRQIVDEKTSKDGGALVRRQNVADNTARADKRQWIPNAADAIFDLDAPNIAYWPPANACIETYMSFRQWVTYGNVVCSGTIDWHFSGEVLFGTPGVVLQPHPVHPQVVQLLISPPAVVPRLVLGQGPLNVAGINAPRYAVAAIVGGYSLTNNGEKP